MISPLISVVKSPPLPDREGETLSVKRNFLYKCKFPLQKENLCPVFRAFSASAGSQWPLVQNNTYAKGSYLGVTYSGTLQNRGF